MEFLVDMMSTLGGLFWNFCFLIITFLILVVIHEGGHFLAARYFKVKVLRFSVGFGKVLWSKWDNQGTEFSLSAIPLGGYVQMLDEDQPTFVNQEEAAASDDQDLQGSLLSKPAWQRMIIALAGPAANFVLAIAVYWLLNTMGFTVPEPYVGVLKENSPAAVAGLRNGDLIRSVDGQPTVSWHKVALAFTERLGDSGTVIVSTQSAGAAVREHRIHIHRWLTEVDDPNPLEAMGFQHQYPPAIMGDINPDSPADLAGFKRHDRVISVDGEAIKHWPQWVKAIRASANQRLDVLVQRQEEERLLRLVPELRQIGDKSFGQAGIRLPTIDVTYNPIEALGQAFKDTGEMTWLTLGFIKKLLSGLVSPTSMGGPLSIADVAGTAADKSIQTFLYILALLSISLAVINLLPIPVLDGGHVLFCIIEMALRKPVPKRIQLVSLQIGSVMVLALMTLAIFSDLNRYLF